MRTIGFAGVGNMGRPMAMRLRDAGYELLVCDVHEPSLAPFRELSVQVATDFSALRGVELLYIMVSSEAQVRDLVLGANGVLGGSTRPSFVCIGSTISPDGVRELGARLAANSVRVLDTPVGGQPPLAAAGELTMMVGGEAADLELVRPVLKVLASRIYHCGALGAATQTKIINNMFSVTNFFVTIEAVRLAREMGLEPQKLFETLDASTGRTSYSRSWTATGELLASMAKDPAVAEVSLNISRKDLGVALQIASRAGMELPVIAGLLGAVFTLDTAALHAAILTALEPSSTAVRGGGDGQGASSAF